MVLLLYWWLMKRNRDPEIVIETELTLTTIWVDWCHLKNSQLMTRHSWSIASFPGLHAQLLSLQYCWHWTGLKTAPPTHLTRLETKPKQDLAGSVNERRCWPGSVGEDFHVQDLIQACTLHKPFQKWNMHAFRQGLKNKHAYLEQPTFRVYRHTENL